MDIYAAVTERIIEQMEQGMPLCCAVWRVMQRSTKR